MSAPNARSTLHLPQGDWATVFENLRRSLTGLAAAQKTADA